MLWTRVRGRRSSEGTMRAWCRMHEVTLTLSLQVCYSLEPEVLENDAGIELIGDEIGWSKHDS